VIIRQPSDIIDFTVDSGQWTFDSGGCARCAVDGTAPYISPYTALFAPIYLVSTNDLDLDRGHMCECVLCV
jgi:hypothetical protein